MKYRDQILRHRRIVGIHLHKRRHIVPPFAADWSIRAFRPLCLVLDFDIAVEYIRLAVKVDGIVAQIVLFKV